MTQDELLLRAVVEDPADATSRHVYADCLEDQGDPAGADLRRAGTLRVWSDGTVFWRVDEQSRTWLLGWLAVAVTACENCLQEAGWRWEDGGWRCAGCGAAGRPTGGAGKA